jgi:hypothetical protein
MRQHGCRVLRKGCCYAGGCMSCGLHAVVAVWEGALTGSTHTHLQVESLQGDAAPAGPCDVDAFPAQLLPPGGGPG